MSTQNNEKVMPMTMAPGYLRGQAVKRRRASAVDGQGERGGGARHGQRKMGPRGAVGARRARKM